MTTITISTNADDQWGTAAGDYENVSNRIFLGHSTSGVGNTFRACSWMPFVIPLPSGKQIVSATLKLVPTATRADAITVRVGCEDADNPAAPANETQLFARVMTTAYNSWTPAAFTIGVQVTVDVTAAVQEVLDRAGFAVNNTLAILIRNFVSDSTDNRRSVASYENTTYAEPILEIVYNSFVPQTPGIL